MVDSDTKPVEYSEADVQEHLRQIGLQDLRAKAFRIWMVEQYQRIADQDMSVEVVRMHGNMYRLVRGYIPDFHPCTLRAKMIKGMMGSLWGAELWISKDVPVGKVELEGKAKKKPSMQAMRKVCKERFGE